MSGTPPLVPEPDSPGAEKKERGRRKDIKGKMGVLIGSKKSQKKNDR